MLACLSTSLIAAQAAWPAPKPSGADLSITKTDSPDPLTVGRNLTYSIIVGNGGPLAATDVTVSDELPSSVSFVSWSATQGSCSGTTTLSCTLGNLSKGATAGVEIVVRANQAGTITNVATVKGNQKDNNQANNQSAASTTVTSPPPDVTIDLAVGIGGMGKAVPLKQRSLTVREGGNGWDILNRAVQEGFIRSYQTWGTPRGTQVRCIDDICGGQSVQVCGFHGYLGWGFYENGALFPSWLGAIKADDGDRFDLTFPQLDASPRC
jgi:uncharacterized repeat protein (TIGR01451 family)